MQKEILNILPDSAYSDFFIQQLYKLGLASRNECYVWLRTKKPRRVFDGALYFKNIAELTPLYAKYDKIVVHCLYSDYYTSLSKISKKKIAIAP